MSVIWNTQPTLSGELVELRPLRADDYDALYSVAADPLIWEQHPARDRYEERVFQEFFREAMASGGALLAIDAKTRQVIGSSRFHGYDAERDEIEIGWTFLSRTHWGGACNGEMKRLMLQHAFTFVSRVVFLVGPDDLRSQKAVEKIGAVRAIPIRCQRARKLSVRDHRGGLRPAPAFRRDVARHGVNIRS